MFFAPCNGPLRRVFPSAGLRRQHGQAAGGLDISLSILAAKLHFSMISANAAKLPSQINCVANIWKLLCGMFEERKMLLVGRFVGNESGATSIEYGLICSLIFLAIVGAINNFATSANGMYGKIASNMK